MGAPLKINRTSCQYPAPKCTRKTWNFIVGRAISTLNIVIISEDLRNLTNLIYIIDREYKIVDFNNGYKRFTIENGGEDILLKWPIGSNILSSIPEIMRSRVKRIYDDVIEKNKIIEREYDCHSPDVFRRFKMRILPFMNGFALHEHCLSNHLD